MKHSEIFEVARDIVGEGLCCTPGYAVLLAMGGPGAAPGFAAVHHAMREAGEPPYDSRKKPLDQFHVFDFLELLRLKAIDDEKPLVDRMIATAAAQLGADAKKRIRDRLKSTGLYPYLP